MGKKDIYQARIIGFCALVAAVAGAVKRVELIGLLFAYLLWGFISGVGGSWIVHRLWSWGKSDEDFLKNQQASGKEGGLTTNCKSIQTHYVPVQAE